MCTNHVKQCTLLLFILLMRCTCFAQQKTDAADALIKRILNDKAKYFSTAIIKAVDDKDVFELESKGSKIVLRGNTPVAIASALYYYLTNYCHCQITWNSDQLSLPVQLPPVKGKIRISSPYKERAYLNYCTFSYTMAWWDWKRWEREIDWMALHGVNMPLAITGQEAVWQNTLRKFNMSDEEIRSFLVGPAYFAWQFMTNIEGWNGPLPQNWIDSHITLGQQILQRERELGMQPVLQGFTGYVPKLLKEKYPDAKIAVKGDWYGVPPGSGQLDPADPLFKEMATTFLKEQEKLFSTNHYYAADPFHEGAPPSNTKEYLGAVGKTMYDVTAAVDPQAVIVMQTWSLREAIAKAIPKDRLLLFDLIGTSWKQYHGFWGYNWVAGVLHNFGGRVYIGGDFTHYTSNAPNLLHQQDSAGVVTGIGIFPEAIEHNPALYEAVTALSWTNKPIDVPVWIRGYIRNRYGVADANANAAWNILLQTVYAQTNPKPSMESPVCARPVLDFKKVAPNGSTRRDYDMKRLWHAWDTLQRVAPAIKALPTYEYDLVDVARQCLVDLALPLQKEIARAYDSKDKAALQQATNRFLSLMDDIDELLATRKEYLLGKWLNDAKQWGKTTTEKRLYERNARTLITTWGPVSKDAVQYDYSNRQWSGLIKGYYKIRWQKFFDFLLAQPDNENRYTEKGLKKVYDRPAYDANDFYKQLAEWENNWLDDTTIYPAMPNGNAVAIAKRLYDKWRGE